MAKENKEEKVWESVEDVLTDTYAFKVKAIQIKNVKNIGSQSDPNSAGDGRKIINNSFTVPLDFVLENEPTVGDWITINKDGKLDCFSAEYFKSNFQ